jgi:hypothetical protein
VESRMLRTATAHGEARQAPSRRCVLAPLVGACASSSSEQEGRQANHAEIERQTTTC